MPERLTDADRRLVGAWAADCAERVLPLFEARVHGDDRPRAAIDGLRRFVRGELRPVPLRGLALAAHASARDTRDPVAAAVARSAGSAGATALMHDTITTMGTLKHALAPAAYAALARGLAEADAAAREPATDAELARALDHCPPDVRAVIRRIPTESLGRAKVDLLVARLDAALREVS